MSRLILIGPMECLEKYRFIQKDLKQTYQLTEIPMEEIPSEEEFRALFRSFDPKDTQALIICDSRLLNSTRMTLFMRVRTLGYKCVKYISPKAVIEDDVTVGENTLIMGGTYIGSQAQIGYCCLIEADCYLGAHVKVAHGATLGAACRLGNMVELGKNSTLEMGCLIRDDVDIGADCYLGIARTYDKDIPARSFFDPDLVDTARIYTF